MPRGPEGVHGSQPEPECGNFSSVSDDEVCIQVDFSRRLPLLPLYSGGCSCPGAERCLPQGYAA